MRIIGNNETKYSITSERSARYWLSKYWILGEVIQALDNLNYVMALDLTHLT